ncbi:MAG TPA: RpiB/LacA/LacB family sugar-phosphate isomerase [Anaerolineaceae bacterium]
MRVAIACDHGGYPLKASVIQTIQSEGHEVVDLGTDSPSPVDYPDIVQKAGMALQEGSVERAILLCGSGVGACIAANKMKGVYASVCHDTYSARQGVEHDAMNALCLGGRVIGLELVKELVKAFLSARVSSEERHQRRIGKTRSLEQGKRI